MRKIIGSEFVAAIPDIYDGILYISVKTNQAMHLCPCGCGIVSSTPLNEWTLDFDGVAVSLTPGIQNECGARYEITRNRIIPL